jgi:hypothetical protein
MAFIAEVLGPLAEVSAHPRPLALDARFDLTEQLRRSTPAATGAEAPVLSAIGSLFSAAGGLVTQLLLAILMLLFGPDLVAAMLAEACMARAPPVGVSPASGDVTKPAKRGRCHTGPSGGAGTVAERQRRQDCGP